MNYRRIHVFLVPFMLLGLLCPHAVMADSLAPVAPNITESLLRKPECYIDIHTAHNSVISPIEWQELQIEDLVMGIAEYTQTSLGVDGLRWLLAPLNNRAQIENRQRIIHTLIEREDILNQLDSALIAIKRGESQLLKVNVIPSDINAVSAHFGLEGINKNFNKSAILLDASAWYHLGGISSILLIGAYLKLRNMQKNYSPWRMKVSPTQYQDWVGEGALTSPVLEDERIALEVGGSAGDKMVVARRCLFNSMRFEGYLKAKFGNKDKEEAPGVVKKKDEQEYSFFQKRLFAIPAKFSDFDYKLMAGSYVYFNQLASDAMIFLPLALLYWTVKELWNALAEQQARYVDIASATRAFKTLRTGITCLAQYTDCSLTEHTRHVLYDKGWDKDITDFVALLESSTFNDRNSWVYRRGNVVKACHLHQAIGTKLSPFLQTVAEWDAYCALAKMYKKVQNRQARYCFAEFVDSATPYVHIDHAWTPLARANDPVTNDVRMGSENHTTRMFLTGPNGCGKSTYMKAMTHSIVLAQSCGLVPATKAELALFDGIRTSLHPQEDVLNGISTFMAQKLRIDQVGGFASRSNEANKLLVLFDEPFSGTTDAQIELRVYQLGQQMMRLPYAASCIATHVEKPTELARTGLFDNYQVEVEELANGGFRRTFKIKPGVAHWWFADHAKVTRFVDWIGQYKKAPIIQQSP
jgi:hypothetical protein